MELTGDHLIPAAPETVWAALNDPETLRRSVPGCTALERTGEHEFTATVLAKVGPVSATFKGKVELADLDPPFAYTLRGRGQGGAAGFAKGEARVSLAPEGGGTHLSYVASVDVGGKLASVGGRLIQGVARKNAEAFFSTFSKVLSGEAVVVEAGPTRAATVAQPVAAPGAVGAHIPLIDRIAWLLLGVALGVAATLLLG